jgi:hypothetical protein
MASAYTTTGWTALLAASVGACATLTGLLFVAVSINLEHVLALRGVPGGRS